MKISQTFLDFVATHANDDVNRLRLKYSDKNIQDFGNLNLEFAFTQIEARRKARKKIPSFTDNPLFMFPSLAASEQATNEAVARFHASLIDKGSSLFDMTAGLGIDDLTFAKADIEVTSCEIDNTKCGWLRHNSEIFKVDKNIEIICNDSIEELRKNQQKFDVIYADPARRNIKGKRLHALSDCIPDVTGNLPLIMDHTDRFMIKSSPLLDISFIINTVKNLYHIYVVCFRGECKETLIEISKGKEFSGVTAIDLDWDKTISEFNCKTSNLNDNKLLQYATQSSPTNYNYIYEPNAAVMKTADWQTLTSRYPDLKKADINTHLFLSDTFYNDFPGRTLRILMSLNKKDMKKLTNFKFNVVTRNYPLDAQQICNKFNLIQGGTDYIYAFRYNGSHHLVRASEL